MHKLRGGIVGLAGAAALLTPVVPASGQPGTAARTAVTVTAGKPSEFAFTLSKSVIPVGLVSFKVVNAGTIVHDFKIAGKQTKNLSPGQSQTITINIKKDGSYRYLCTVPGHAAAGMNGVLKARSSVNAALKLGATLNAAQEVPRPKGALAKATGHLSVTLTGLTLRWKLTFSHLSSKATGAHIHLGPRGKAGPVLVAFCGPCTSPRSGSAKLTSAQATAIKNGRTYANVHTTKNADGEIRGQIVRTR
jgi:plastocyanin